jgi:hypothetical protein
MTHPLKRIHSTPYGFFWQPEDVGETDMPKQNAAPVEIPEEDFLDKYDGVALDDIPDADPLLAPGYWEFQFVGFKAETKDGDTGPYTMITTWLDPTEPEDVDEPNEDFADLRQFHRIFVMKPGDMKNVKAFAVAFGADAALPAMVRDPETRARTWPALEDAKGGSAIGVVKHGKHKKTKQPEARIYFN